MKKSDVRIVKLALVAVIVSASGWMVFEGFIKLFQLEELGALSLIFGGLVLAWITAKIGLRRIR